MPQCKKCGMIFMSHELDRFGLCEDCADKRERTSIVGSHSNNSPKSCSRCGRHGMFLYIHPDGFCDYCWSDVQAERKAQQRKDRLFKNYQSFQNGAARPDVQRIYDVFRNNYPDAPIAGIEPKNDGKCLIVHLENGDKYDVSFNSLTNDVYVSKVENSFVGKNPISDANFCVVAPEKKGGRFSTIFKAICWVVGIYFACAFLLTLSSKLSPKSSLTPKATAAPTATAEASDTLSWIKYYSGIDLPSDVSLTDAYTETSAGEKILVIKYFMSPMREGEDYLLAAAQTIINAGSAIRSHGVHKDFDIVNFLFYGGFIDKYGNRFEDVGIRALYDRSDFELLNFDHFSDYLYTDPSRIIEASDEYIIYPAYLK